MNEIASPEVLDQLRSYFYEYGLIEAVGGAEALEEGLRELSVGVMPVLAELAAAQMADDGLAEAVFDDERYPHLVRVHGFLNDVLVMDVPSDLLPIAREMAEQGVPEAQTFRKAATVVFDRGSEAQALMARFVLFEALCLNQRLLLHAGEAHLEAMDGRGRDVEAIAEREVDLAGGWEEYRQKLFRLEDPLRALVAAAAVGLKDHIDHLRGDLRALRAEVHENLEQRREILEVMDRLPADQAVLVSNECAAIFGEEKLEAEQLRLHHPAMLGPISRDAIYQRVHRLPARIERLKIEPLERRRPSLADLILRRGGEKDEVGSR